MKKSDFPSLKLYDSMGIPYVGHAGDWTGPLWTGHCMMLDIDDSYGDPGYWHELAHWMAAAPEQRQYPDFALGRQVNAATGALFTSTSPHAFDPDHIRRTPNDRNPGWGEETIPLTEASRQEGIACDALFAYEPVMGIWGWREKVPNPGEDVNRAFWDFAGYPLRTPDPDEWRSRAGEVYDTVLFPLMARWVIRKVQRKTVQNYFDQFLNFSEDD